MDTKVNPIQQRLQTVQTRIQAACRDADRDPRAVKLLAVSKAQPAEKIRALARCGQRLFGENYLAEAGDKQQRLSELALEWHFIGPVQSNKTRALAERFAWVHSVDRDKIIRRLDAQHPRGLEPLNLCLQVNLDLEAQKAGCAPEDLLPLAALVSDCRYLKLRGLMVIPAPRADFSAQKAVFESAANLYRRLKAKYPQVDTFSAGMSGDLEAAIAAGSTLVRVGTALFGSRRG